MTDTDWLASEGAVECLIDMTLEYGETHDAREIHEMARRKVLGLIPSGMTPEDHMLIYGDGSSDRPMGLLSARTTETRRS